MASAECGQQVEEIHDGGRWECAHECKHVFLFIQEYLLRKVIMRYSVDPDSTPYCGAHKTTGHTAEKSKKGQDGKDFLLDAYEQFEKNRFPNTQFQSSPKFTLDNF